MPLPLWLVLLALFLLSLHLLGLLHLLHCLDLLDLFGLGLDPEDLPDWLFFDLIDHIAELLLLLDWLAFLHRLPGDCGFFTVLLVLIHGLLDPSLSFEVLLLFGSNFLSSLFGLEDADFIFSLVLDFHRFSLAYHLGLMSGHWSSVFGLENILLMTSFHVIQRDCLLIG